MHTLRCLTPDALTPDTLIVYLNVSETTFDVLSLLAKTGLGDKNGNPRNQ